MANENSKRKGNMVELETMLEFMKFGYNVLSPYGDCERYDYVVDIGNEFIRVQCKKAIPRRSGAAFSFRAESTNRQNGQFVHRLYTKREIDYFATMYDGKCYLLPVEECGTEKTLRLLPTKSGMKKGISEAKKYELSEVVKKLNGDGSTQNT